MPAPVLAIAKPINDRTTVGLFSGKFGPLRFHRSTQHGYPDELTGPEGCDKQCPLRELSLPKAGRAGQ